jgi:hypothetical protein
MRTLPTLSMIVVVAGLASMSLTAHADTLVGTSSTGEEWYLVSSRKKGGPDGTGANGQIRIVQIDQKKHKTERVSYFNITCSGPNPIGVNIDNDSEDVNPTGVPSNTQKLTYDLWWAVCRGTFKKF